MYTLHGRYLLPLLAFATLLLAGSLLQLRSLATVASTVVVWCRDAFVATMGQEQRAGYVAAALIAAIGAIALVRCFSHLATALRGHLALRRRMARARTVRSGKVDAAAASVGMLPPTVLDLAEPFAFTVGFLSPRIVLSRGLVRRLTQRELAAVLAHERAHQRGRDPLRGVAESTLGAIFFWVPLLSDLVAHARLRREIAADRAALAVTDRRTLASALMRSATSAASSVPVGAAAFGRFSDRVGALAAGSSTVPLTLRISRLAASVAFLLCLTVVAGLRPASASTEAERCAIGASASDAAAFTPLVRIISPMGEMTDVAP